MTDLLATIKTWRLLIGPWPWPETEMRIYQEVVLQDFDWLITEVERLRGLLVVLEWSAYTSREVGSSLVVCPCCPACKGSEPDHRVGCWLAAELQSNTNDPPPPK